MTVRELIKMLENYPADAEVKIAQPTHDFWRRVAAVAPDSVEWAKVVHRDYHQSDIIIDDDREDDDEIREVIVIF